MKKPDLPEMVTPPCWRLTPPADFCEFLRELPNFVPENSILAVEGGGAPDIETYLQERPAEYENETDQGFWKLRPKTFYTPITTENLRGLADLSERHNELEVCGHLRVYSNNRIVLSWHDLPSDPIYVSDQFDEIKLKRVCDLLGCESLSYAATEKEL